MNRCFYNSTYRFKLIGLPRRREDFLNETFTFCTFEDHFTIAYYGLECETFPFTVEQQQFVRLVRVVCCKLLNSKFD